MRCRYYPDRKDEMMKVKAYILQDILDLTIQLEFLPHEETDVDFVDASSSDLIRIEGCNERETGV